MDVVHIALAIALGMMAIGGLTMVAFSARNIFSGRHDLMKVGVMLVPAVIFGVTFGILGDATEAGVLTMMLMIGLMALFIAYSGLRRSFK